MVVLILTMARPGVRTTYYGTTYYGTTTSTYYGTNYYGKACWA